MTSAPAAGDPLRVARDRRELAGEAFRVVRECLRSALERREEASLVLAGGSTPLGLYQRLGRGGGSLEWERIRLFWSDERCVEPGDRASNFGAVREALLSKLGRRPAGVHRILGELSAAAAAESYESELRRHLGRAPSFDLVILGIGADGHTASLFPGGPELESPRLVAPSRSPQPPVERVTLTLTAINAARAVLFLVSGAGKRQVLRRLRPPAPDLSLPAARVRPLGAAPVWIVDREAAGEAALARG